MIFQTNSFVVVVVLKSILDRVTQLENTSSFSEASWIICLPRWFKPSSENVRFSVDSSFLKRKSQVFLTYLRSNGWLTGDSVEGQEGINRRRHVETVKQLQKHRKLLCWWLGLRSHSSRGLNFTWVKICGLWNGSPGDYYSMGFTSQQRSQHSWLQPRYWKTLFAHPFHFSDKRSETKRPSSLTEDEMYGWHHRPNGYEFEQIPGDSEGQGSLACCSPWGYKELDRIDTT